MNGNSEEMEIDLGRLLSALWRRGWMIGVVSALCGLLTLLGTFLFITPKYQSSVMFHVSGGELADSCIVMLKTGETLLEVCDAAGVDGGCEDLEKMITAEIEGSTGFFTVTAVSEDAGEAKDITDAVARILPGRMGVIAEDISLIVVDAPRMAKKPASPDYPKAALTGALAGFALSAGTVAMREVFAPGPENGSGKYENSRTKREKSSRQHCSER